MSDQSHGTVTFFFSDIEGSTRLLKALRDQYPKLLAEHRAIVSAAFADHRGREVDTQGDAFFAAFSGARDAVLCALAIRAAHARHDWPGGESVKVRIGIHTGYALENEGRFSGLAVHRAARISAVAKGGQILVSQTAQAILEDEEEELGFRLVDLGERRLKDLDRPARLFEVADDAPAPEDSEPGAPAAEDVQLPLPPEIANAGALPLVSRTRELAAAEALIDDPERERLGVVWLFGEPGIGKTRLAIELARRAHDAGDAVLFGRCSEDLPLAYQPFLEALHHFVAHTDAATLSARLGGAARELVRLAPMLRDKLPGLEPVVDSHPDIEQYHLFGAVKGWLAHGGGDHKVVAVLDDLQWATDATTALVGHIARSSEPSRAVLICTAWRSALEEEQHLSPMVEALDRQGVPMVEIELSGLEVDEIAELISLAAWRDLDQRPDQLASKLLRETAGNPLFLEALLAELVDAESWRAGSLPHSVGATVHARLTRLAPEVVDLLRMAAVAGVTFDVRVAARACERNELATLDELELAARAGLVREGALNEYYFTHAIVRSVLLSELSETRRVRMHLRVGEALEAVHANDLASGAIAALAHHFYEAVPAGAAEKALQYLLLAAEDASRLLSYGEALGAYRHALTLIDRVERPGLSRAELLLALGQAEYRAGMFHAARETLSSAAAAAADEGAAALLAASAITHEAATTESGATAADSVELLRLSEAALSRDDPSLRSLTLASLARALEFCGRHRDSVASSEAALEVARRVADPAAVAAVIVRTTFPYLRLEHAGLVAERSAELEALAHLTSNDEILAWSSMFGVWASIVEGDGVRAETQLAQLVALVDKLRQPWWQYTVTQMRYVRALLSADLADASRVLEVSRELGENFGGEYEGGYGLGMFLLLRETGKLRALAPTLRTLVESNPVGTFWAPGFAAICAELDMLDGARAQLLDLTSNDLRSLPIDGTRPLWVGLLAEVCARLKAPEPAEALFRELLPSEGKVLLVWGTLACLGPVDRLLALLAPLVGRTSEAERWFQSALEVSERLNSPLWRARLLLDLGRHLEGSDPGRSRELLAEAEKVAKRHALIDVATSASARRAERQHGATTR